MILEKKDAHLCLSSISCCLYVFNFLDSNHLCQRIPRGVLEVVYGLNIALPQEGEDPTRAPYADELLSAYGCKFLLLCVKPNCVPFTSEQEMENQTD